MTNLGTAMAGGNPAEDRQDRDSYPTPVEVTWGLLENEKLPRAIWEPMCGNWAMAAELEKAGHKVVGTDIHPLDPRGKVLDFLAVPPRPVPAIVTNPPFDLAERIIRHAKKFNPTLLALVLKASYWHASGRKALWDHWRPSRIYPLTWRPDFLDKGRPTMEVMWCVWDASSSGECVYAPMKKPSVHPVETRASSAIH